MKSYLLKILAVVVAVIAVHYAVLFAVRAPIPAEYWVRELIIVKKYQAEHILSPKLIFTGGSCTLFGIDAARVQRELGRPAMNLGLHASLRLEQHLAITLEVAKPGDTVILSLEPAYYDTYTETWTTWNLRNALAWDAASFDAMPFSKRLDIFAHTSDPGLSWDLLTTKLLAPFEKSAIERRTTTLQPEEKILEHYFATRLAPRERIKTFSYDISNIDENGDILNTHYDGSPFQGDTWPVTRPSTISAYARNLLVPFLAEMKQRNVRVIFDYTPYLVYSKPGDGWQEDEEIFRKQVEELGCGVLERRDAFFYPNTLFFNSNLHLNEEGRDKRTATLIEALREKL